jgi:(2Fe-2S) ferredoxin
LACSNLLLVCVKGKNCSKRDGSKVFRALKKRIAKADLGSGYKVKKSDCFGLCEYAPVISFVLEGLDYGKVTSKDCREIIKDHSRGKRPVKRLLIKKKK